MKILKKILFAILDYFIQNLSIKYYSRVNVIKRLALRKMGAIIGVNPSVDQGVDIRAPEKLILGDNVVLSKNVLITCYGGVTLEDNVMVGYQSIILSANHNIPQNLLTPIRFSGHTFKRVIIKEGAWIGANVVVLPGVTIGEGAVVAAGAVVTRDVGPYEMVGGVPTKLLRKRFDNK